MDVEETKELENRFWEIGKRFDLGFDRDGSNDVGIDLEGINLIDGMTKVSAGIEICLELVEHGRFESATRRMDWCIRLGQLQMLRLVIDDALNYDVFEEVE